MASNGRLDLSTLTKVPLSAGGFGHLENLTAHGWFAAREDLIRTTGTIPVIISDGLYRDYARQVYWKQYWTGLGKPNNAATPGTSNHGLGTAVDVNNISAYNQKTLDTVMARHGFVRDTSETWHYHHTSINPADAGSKPIGTNMPLDDNDWARLNSFGASIVDQIIRGVPSSVWSAPLVHPVNGVSGTASTWLINLSDAVGKLKTVIDSINTKVTAQGNAAPGSFSGADRAMLDDIANKLELSAALTNVVNLVNSHADANKAQIIQEIDTHSGSSLSAFTATITPVE